MIYTERNSKFGIGAAPKPTFESRSVYLVAGEPSGDLYGADLAKNLLKLQPTLTLKGVAGEHMRAFGINGSVCVEELAVMGFTDVITALPKILRLFFRVKNEILTLQPSAVVCIDYPDFNLRLARSLRRSGYLGKLIHYISPSVWAWRKNRASFMAKHLDRLLTILPFEADHFSSGPLPVTYVGHPLVEKTKSHRLNPHFLRDCQIDPHKKILAIFPGSRQKELNNNLSLQLKTALALKEKDPNLEIVLSKAHNSLQVPSNLPCKTVGGEHTYDLMSHTHLALAVSGTVTLELALFEVPTIVQYAIRALDTFLAQKIFRIHLPHYCLVNLLAGKRIFPEFFGPFLKASTLLSTAFSFLESEERRSLCREECRVVKKILGENNASLKAAQEILVF